MTSCLSLLCLFACVGPPGEEGKPGADGATGPTGSDGADGTGSDGSDGANGSDGSDGSPGWDAHSGDAPWGLTVAIEAVSGASGAAVQVGDSLTVRYTVQDDAGVDYRLSELDTLHLQLSGPTTHYQRVLTEQDLSLSTWDGSAYTITLPPIPAVYAAPPNDTPDIGVDAGDWSGQALVDGTYTLALWAAVQGADGTWEAATATTDLLLGAATTLEAREVVTEAACLDCHGTLVGHSGSRADLALCLGCHVAGAEDRYSDIDSSTTPATSVQWVALIHGLHMGGERSPALVVNAHPTDSSVEGYPNYNVVDYGDIAFPAWPQGPATCGACHDGAADGDVEDRPSRVACGACHANVDFATGDGHGGGAQTDDDGCVGCHFEGGEGGGVTEVHANARDDLSVNPGVQTEIVAISGGSGPGGSFLPGDQVTVQLRLTDGSGLSMGVDALYADETELLFSGPTSHYQLVARIDGAALVAGAEASGDTYIFTFPEPIPSVYPPQANDSPDLGVEVGDWQGLPLVDGTYTVAVNAVIQYQDGSRRYKYSDAATSAVLFGGATTIESRAVVAEANCTACHGTLEFHSSAREGLDLCITCHTAGAEDAWSTEDPTTTPGTTIHFPVLMHKLHHGASLSADYAVNVFSSYPNYVTNTFEWLVFPRMDGGTAACLACHDGSDAYTDPQTVACLSCHDSPDAAAHAAVNTDETYGESCDVCHGPGREFAVDVVHGG